MAGLHIQRLIIELIVIAFRITSNPLVTGPLLYILTRRTDQSGIILKAHFTKQINRLPTEVNLEKIVKILKYLFVLGFVPKANAFLNTISQNNWLLTAPTSEWVWEKEVAVITGGSAGIGEQVVLRLIRKGVRVAILDISPPTHPELKNGKSCDL